MSLRSLRVIRRRAARAALPPGWAINPGIMPYLVHFAPKTGDWYRFVRADLHHRIIKFTDKEGEFVKYREELNTYLGTI